MKKFRNYTRPLYFLAAALLLFKINAAIAFEAELSQAFAEFILVLYSNTQSVNRSATNICLYGTDEVASRLSSDNRVVSIDDKARNFKNCRLIYIAKDKEKFMKSSVNSMNQSGALTIGIFNSFVVNGGAVLVDLGRRDFELTINAQSLKTSGAKLDSSIIALIVSTKFQ